MCGVILFGVLSAINFITPRLNEANVITLLQAVSDWDYLSGDNFMKSVFVLREVHSRSDRVALFAGDSHIEQYWPRVNAAIKSNPDLASAIFATSGGCPPLPASLVRSGERVVILSSNPSSPTFNPHVVFHRLRGVESSRLQAVDKAEFNQFIAPIEDKLTDIATRTGAAVIRPADYFCDGGVGPASDQGGSPNYLGDHHLRAASVIKRAVFIDATSDPNFQSPDRPIKAQ